MTSSNVRGSAAYIYIHICQGNYHSYLCYSTTMTSESENRNSFNEIIIDQSLPTTTSIYDMNDLTNNKSLISIYDNSSQIDTRLSIGILGQNQRSQAFVQRLNRSGLGTPILCDRTFDFSSLNILLITEYVHDFNFATDQQLFIDVREIDPSQEFLSIPGTYRACGNLSNREIEYGTDRTRIFIEQNSPMKLIQFISDLKCSSRGVIQLDFYTYKTHQIKSFHVCLLSFIVSLIFFILFLCISLFRQQKISIYRRTSSIMALTSIHLLALVYFIRPMIELTEWILSKHRENYPWLLKCLQSRRYLCWYSLMFACLHIVFLIFSRIIFDFTRVSIGLLSLLCLLTISIVYFPQISESLLWKHYHYLVSYFGTLTLFICIIHQQNLRLLTLVFPVFVLMFRLIISIKNSRLLSSDRCTK